MSLNEPLTQHRITVLLVDDQPMVAAAVKRMLASQADIDFHSCQDPTLAVKAASEISPTVILQDLVMPEIDGLTLVKFFRAHPKLKNVPLIVLSSKEEAVTKAEAFGVGANDYLVKLPDAVELIARIRYHSRAYINLLERNEAFEALRRSQEALAAELARAAEHVISLLPPAVSEGAIRTEWRLVPSAQLGGDAFGYHWLDPEHFAVYLLDVCDHGVGSALLAVSALNALRSQTLPAVDFRNSGEVLEALNEAYQMEQHNGLYFTMWYGVFNTASGELRYASAGHPPAFLFSASGEAVPLGVRNPIVGGMPGIRYRSDTIKVEQPARLYVFSDGVYEVHDREGVMWSLEGLREFLLRPGTGGGSEIDSLYAFLREMSGQDILPDDFSMLRVSFG
ncbi:MAG: SpoIIE family protein phosphatase [Candidatus Latescibacterota bacterium]